jgi:hypothetical protein
MLAAGFYIDCATIFYKKMPISGCFDMFHFVRIPPFLKRRNPQADFARFRPGSFGFTETPWSFFPIYGIVNKEKK